MGILGNSQHSAFWTILDRNYNKLRYLNETLSNRIVAALASSTVQTQNESIPFPYTGSNRYYGRSVSQGNWYSPPPVTSQTPTRTWGDY